MIKVHSKVKYSQSSRCVASLLKGQGLNHSQSLSNYFIMQYLSAVACSFLLARSIHKLRRSFVKNLKIPSGTLQVHGTRSSLLIQEPCGKARSNPAIITINPFHKSCIRPGAPTWNIKLPIDFLTQLIFFSFIVSGKSNEAKQLW